MGCSNCTQKKVQNRIGIDFNSPKLLSMTKKELFDELIEFVQKELIGKSAYSTPALHKAFELHNAFFAVNVTNIHSQVILNEVIRNLTVVWNKRNEYTFEEEIKTNITDEKTTEQGGQQYAETQQVTEKISTGKRGRKKQV